MTVFCLIRYVYIILEGVDASAEFLLHTEFQLSERRTLSVVFFNQLFNLSDVFGGSECALDNTLLITWDHNHLDTHSISLWSFD